jgi:hypothetical protein
MQRTLEALDIEIESITSVEKAEKALARAMHWLKEKANLNPSVIEGVKSSVSVMYGYNIEWRRLSESCLLKAMVRTMKMIEPRIRRGVMLNWDLRLMWRYIRGKSVIARLSWDDLMEITVVLVKVLGRLRYTEMEVLDSEETEPEENGWRLLTRIKGDIENREVKIEKIREQALDPVRHLIEIRNRIRRKKAEAREEEENGDNDNNNTNNSNNGNGNIWSTVNETTFWWRENGKKMNYTAIRKAAIECMRKAGITDKKAHHLKHAAVTALEKAGA